MNSKPATEGIPRVPGDSNDWLTSTALAFVAYSPYETFSGQMQTAFVDRSGGVINPEEDNPDTEALWTVGREAYNSLRVQSRDDFILRYSRFIEAIAKYREIIHALVAAGRMVDQNDRPVTLQSLALENREASEVLSLVWPLLESNARTRGADVTLLQPEYFLFACLREIDNALIGIALDGRSAVSSTVQAVNALANAQAIASGNNELKRARKQMASAGAIARHRKDPKQVDKKFVYQCYLAWRAERSRYKNKARFARDMLDKCEHLESSKIIENWVRQWDRQKPESGTLQAE